MILPVAFILVRSVPPPTAPPNVMAPAVPAFSVRADPPSTVVVDPEKLIAAPAGLALAFVVSNCKVPESATGPENVMELPLVVMFPAMLIEGDVPLTV